MKNYSSFIGRNVQIIGVNKLDLGKNCSLGDYLWLNIDRSSFFDNKIVVNIGGNSHLGRNNFISVKNSLQIGEYFFSSCYCSIIGATHTNADPFHPYIASSVVGIGSGIDIGTNVFMGAHSIIAGANKIGFGSIISAGSIVTQDVPPLSIVSGVPAVVRRRFSICHQRWIKIEEYGNEEIISEQEYIKMIKDKKIALKIPYFAASAKTGWL